MDWLGVVFVFAVGWLVWSRWSRSRRKEAVGTSGLELVDRQRLQAEGRYLDGLRRELALWLLHENPSSLREAYRSARNYDFEMRKAGSDRVAADRASLSAKYPLFSDFDVVALKHFVPFRAEMMSELEVIQHYLDISKFLTLLSIEHPDSQIRPFSDKDEEVLDRIIQESQDADLYREIEIAMGRYYAFCRKPEQVDEKFSDREYEVFPLYNDEYTPETRYGIVVKSDDRRGIYWFFIADSGKTYEGYAEADERFEKRRSLMKR